MAGTLDDQRYFNYCVYGVHPYVWWLVCTPTLYYVLMVRLITQRYS